MQAPGHLFVRHPALAPGGITCGGCGPLAPAWITHFFSFFRPNQMQLIVLGMHRSGTSMLMRLLNLMGAYFGAQGAGTPAGEENPKGFWERWDVRMLNDLLLHSAGCDWHRVSEFEPGRLPEAALAEFRARAARLVLELDGHRPWAIKDPRMCLLLPMWAPFLESPVCVHVIRHPAEVASSLQRRNRMPLPAGLALWQVHLASALEHAQTLPATTVFHQQIMQDGHAATATLLRDLEALGVRGLRQPSKNEISAFISDALYRERAQRADLLALRGSPQVALYEQLLDCPNPASLDPRSLSAALPLAELKQYESTLPNPSAFDLAGFLEQRDRNPAARERLARRELRQLRRTCTQLGEQLRSSVEAIRKLESDLRELREACAVGQNDVELIRSSRWFDAGWYLQRHGAHMDRLTDPAAHYLQIGASRGYQPGPEFDAVRYLQANPDVAATGMNPLLHFIRHGEREGRAPTFAAQPERHVRI